MLHYPEYVVELVHICECYSHDSGVKIICITGLKVRVHTVKVQTSLCEGVCDEILELRFLFLFLVVAHFVASSTGRKCAVLSLSPPHA